MSSHILNQGIDQFATILDGVSDDQWDLPTPCSQWSVRQLADHVLATTAQFTVMAQGGQPDWAAAPASYEKPAESLREQGREFVSVVDASGGSFPVGMAAGELAVHTWDLVSALGGDTGALDPAVAEAGYEFMKQSLTDEMRGEAFGPEQPAPESANAYERAAAFAGRQLR